MQGSAPSLKRAPLPRAVQGRAPASCRPAAPLVPAGLHFLPSPPPLFAGRLPPLTGYQAAPSLLSFAPRISPQFYSLPHVTHRVKLHLRRVTHTHTGAPSPATGRQRPTEERQPGSKRRARRGPHGKRRALTENAERPAGGGNGRARRRPPRKEPSGRGNERSAPEGRRKEPNGRGKARTALPPGAARAESTEWGWEGGGGGRAPSLTPTPAPAPAGRASGAEEAGKPRAFTETAEPPGGARPGADPSPPRDSSPGGAGHLEFTSRVPTHTLAPRGSRRPPAPGSPLRVPPLPGQSPTPLSSGPRFSPQDPTTPCLYRHNMAGEVLW